MKIRNAKGRFVGRKAMDDMVSQLHRAGFHLGYAWRADAARFGYLSSSHLSGEYGNGHRWLTVTGEASEQYGEPYVSFGDVAAGEDTYGQTPAWVRSNFRAIPRDYPDLPWVNLSYLSRTDLGCFVSDLTDDIIDLMVGLKEQYPCYDESDWSELEHEEIHESWGEYMAREVRGELSEPAQVMWDALGERTVADIVWACVSEEVFGNYPEHQGVEVVWGDTKERAADLRPYLIHAYVSQVRQASTLPFEWDMVKFIKSFQEGK